MSELSCAVCRGQVDRTEPFVAVDKEHVEEREPVGRDEYVLHEGCASAVFEGWMPL